MHVSARTHTRTHKHTHTYVYAHTHACTRERAHTRGRADVLKIGRVFPPRCNATNDVAAQHIVLRRLQQASGLYQLHVVRPDLVDCAITRPLTSLALACISVRVCARSRLIVSDHALFMFLSW